MKSQIEEKAGKNAQEGKSAPIVPSNQHRQLLEGAGTWEGTMTMSTPDAPKTPAPATQTVEAFGEFWIKMNFKSQVMGREYLGSGVLGYDPKRKKYIGTWADTMSPALTVMEGDFDPQTKALVMRWTGMCPQTGQMMENRYEAITTPESYTSTFYKGSGANSEKTMVLELKRNGPKRSGNQPSVRDGSAPSPKLLEIRREFQVPVARLFEAFTSAEALKAWWWPNGLHADRIDFDFREGGRYFISMNGQVQGKDVSGGMTGEIEEIVENERIVMTDRFADEKGRAISAAEAGMPGQWPEEISITFEFEATGKAASRFRLAQEGIPDEMQKDCVQGWSESFDKLERYLARRKN